MNAISLLDKQDIRKEPTASVRSMCRATRCGERKRNVRWSIST